MSIWEYHDPIISTRRKGTEDDPYIPITQSLVIKDNKVLLAEIPDKFNRVQVTGYVEIQQGVPQSDEFLVDYINGIVTFNESENNKTVSVSYYGTGATYFPVSRVWTKTNGTDVLETLQDILDNGNDAISALKELDTVITELQEKIDSADTAIDNKITEIQLQADTAIDNKMLDIQSQYDIQKQAWDSEINNKLIAMDNKITETETTRQEAEIQANYAKTQGDYALSAINELNDAVTTTKLIWKPYVDTYTDIATTYPNPEIGWTTQTKDDNTRYRWDGTEWVAIESLSSGGGGGGINVVISSTPPTNAQDLWIDTSS